MSGKVSQIEETSAYYWKTCEQICTFFREIVSSMFLLRQKITQQQSYRDVAPRVWGPWPSKNNKSDDEKCLKCCKDSCEENLSYAERLPMSWSSSVCLYLYFLPSSQGNLKNLVVLNIWGNELERLPPEIGLLPNLKVLFSYCNCLKVKNSRCSALPITSWQVSQAAWSPCTSWPS